MTLNLTNTEGYFAEIRREKAEIRELMLTKGPLRTNEAQRLHSFHGETKILTRSHHGNCYHVTRHADVRFVLEGPHVGQWQWTGYLLDEIDFVQHERGLPGGFSATKSEADRAAQEYATSEAPLANQYRNGCSD